MNCSYVIEEDELIKMQIKRASTNSKRTRMIKIEIKTKQKEELIRKENKERQIPTNTRRVMIMD